jgi:hypothetical protein
LRAFAWEPTRVTWTVCRMQITDHDAAADRTTLTHDEAEAHVNLTSSTGGGGASVLEEHPAAQRGDEHEGASRPSVHTARIRPRREVTTA